MKCFKLLSMSIPLDWNLVGKLQRVNLLLLRLMFLIQKILTLVLRLTHSSKVSEFNLSFLMLCAQYGNNWSRWTARSSKYEVLMRKYENFDRKSSELRCDFQNSNRNSTAWGKNWAKLNSNNSAMRSESWIFKTKGYGANYKICSMVWTS